MCKVIGVGKQFLDFIDVLVHLCYDLITQVATLGLRLEDELGVRGRECTID